MRLHKGRRVENARVLAVADHDAPPPPMADELRLWIESGQAKRRRAENIN